MNKNYPYKRTSVIGVTGSGKSTLAQKLAHELGASYVELDALFWEPDWKEAEPAIFADRVERALASEYWVSAGNYSSVRDALWRQANALIWLDYALPLVSWQLAKRTTRRWWYQEELWNGNYEPFWPHLKIWSEESIFNWLLKSYWRRRREYPILFLKPEYQHLKIFHFKSPEETDQWLAHFTTE